MTNATEIPNRPIALAEYLGVELDTLRKMMHNRQLISGRFSRYAELEPETVEKLVQIYQPEGEEGKVETSIRKLESGTETTEEKRSENKSGKSEKRKRNALIDYRKTDAVKKERITGKTESHIAPTGNLVQTMLLLVALASMYVQMDHTAQVIVADHLVVNTYHQVKAWMFAFGVQFTGLSMSLFKGNQWYLRGYGLADFIINLLYYRPWIDNTSEAWAQSLLLSALLVLTIFSYTQIASGFLKAKNRNDD